MACIHYILMLNVQYKLNTTQQGNRWRNLKYNRTAINVLGAERSHYCLGPLIVTYCAVGEEEVAPVVVHWGEHCEEQGEQQHYDEDDHNHARVQSQGDLWQRYKFKPCPAGACCDFNLTPCGIQMEILILSVCVKSLFTPIQCQCQAGRLNLIRNRN